MMWIRLLKETFNQWRANNVPSLAAALAFFTMFSLAPLLVVVIAAAGLFYDQTQAQQQIIGSIYQALGPEGGELVKNLLEAANKQGTGIWASVVGLGTLFLGATGVFMQLQNALNQIWEIEPQPGGFMQQVRTRLTSFGLILLIGVLILASQVLNTWLSAVMGGLPGSDGLWRVLEFGVSLGLLTLMFALVYKFLPDTPIAWKDVMVGALVTALLFNIGRFAIGLYMAQSSTSSVYGAAGSLVVILLWIYYSAQIILFGAQFTHAYAHRHGSKNTPPSPNESMVSSTLATGV